MRLAAAPASGGAEGGGPQSQLALRAVHMLMAWADRQAVSSSQAAAAAQPLKPGSRGGIRSQSQQRRCPVAVMCCVLSLKAQLHGKVGCDPSHTGYHAAGGGYRSPCVRVVFTIPFPLHAGRTLSQRGARESRSGAVASRCICGAQPIIATASSCTFLLLESVILPMRFAVSTRFFQVSAVSEPGWVPEIKLLSTPVYYFMPSDRHRNVRCKNPPHALYDGSMHAK